MIKLSICIPTYNRSSHLANCLNSIVLCNDQSVYKFQICVSDNNSDDGTEDVVRSVQSKLNIKYHKNKTNIGMTRNFLNVVSMAEGDFVWMIGDDDLLMPNAVSKLLNLIDQHPQVNFIYANSFHLNAEYLKSYPSPFDTANLPNNMEPFSDWPSPGEMNFLELINPRISFDFLGGIFLSVFKREKWMQHTSVLDDVAVQDNRTFSHFDNTFPHIKIFAYAFASSRAYYNSEPLNVCLTGVREWAPMYTLVRSVRLVEALQVYRQNGLPYWRYLRCKNFALNNFVPDLINMYLKRGRSGYRYIQPARLVLNACCFPNFYLSIVYFVGRRIRSLFKVLLANNKIPVLDKLS